MPSGRGRYGSVCIRLLPRQTRWLVKRAEKVVWISASPRQRVQPSSTCVYWFAARPGAATSWQLLICRVATWPPFRLPHNPFPFPLTKHGTICVTLRPSTPHLAAASSVPLLLWPLECCTRGRLSGDQGLAACGTSPIGLGFSSEGQSRDTIGAVLTASKSVEGPSS
ncbi:hypothetical protein BT67DRAFT_303621 [Trichocladium antarcticum]|uniref:Uncharacterized protein n=1 Tax=Trichocladium antarcticum TaxID=1450529 RepID=A0AAN6ZEP3_9PEZI|nr:hypothetical protein BT67DRAFT_303621 [Trichocladium antarcticum]